VNRACVYVCCAHHLFAPFRFPSWMWANEEMKSFVLWLALFNAKKPANERCGIWGLDLYSLHLSMRRVLEYLEEHDKEMAKLVRLDYSCFGRLEPQTYGLLVERGLIPGCRSAVVSALTRVAAQRSRFVKEALTARQASSYLFPCAPIFTVIDLMQIG
jgi:erythromycin esterase-like protein